MKMPVVPLDTSQFFCLSVDIKISIKQARRDQHMGRCAICQHVLETTISSHTVIQVKEAEKWSCGLACECYGKL